MLIAAFVGILFGADQLISWLFAATTIFYWTIFLPIALLLTFYFVDYFLYQSQIQGKRRQMILGGAMGSILLLTAIFSGLAIQKVAHFSYVKYRAAVHEKGPDQIILDERFDSGQMGQILRAAQNQWYINTYLRQAVAEDGRSNSYFNLRPHFDKGSSYTTQTTDLVVTRYIISEHGVGVVFLLILLFFSLTAVYPLVVDMAARNHFVPFGMLLLLFMTALFIWLTATNRFIFFGQDFPLISLTSLFTLVFSLGLILTVIVSVPIARTKRQENKRIVAVPIVVLLMIGLSLQLFKSGEEQENINFNPSLDQARADFNDLNDEFLTFQNKLKKNYPPDSLIYLFHQARPDSIISSHTYTQSIYNQFVQEEEDKTNPSHLLYLVQRPQNGKLRYYFAINPAYYLVRPLRQHDQAWTGNLLAASENASGAFLLGQGAGAKRIQIAGDSAQIGLENQLSRKANQLRTAIIPGTWLQQAKPAILVWASKTGESVPGFTLSNPAFGNVAQLRKEMDPAVCLQAGDVLQLNSKESAALRYRYEEDYKAYLAKNIWLNGDRRMFFPLGEKLLWAYYYAEAAKNARAGTDRRHEDVQVSLDFSLMQNLHNVAETHFRKHNWERQRLGLVVLNGNGQLRALTDYKPQDAVDPNDIDEIHEKNREFHLRRNNHDER
ncbi:MAG TPA: hypothetical protein ENJ82_05220, partial [Bacteroidetes bacterium]|nr:hypothetical protein [Bacteroidota bacterium]